MNRGSVVRQLRGSGALIDDSKSGTWAAGTGLEAIEEIEVICAELCAQVFRAGFAEIRVASGALANLYAFMAMAEPGRNVLRFTLDEPDEREFGLWRDGGETWLARGRERWIAASELKIGGDHNLANALAALAMGHALGLRREAMLAALREFPGLAHRTTLVLEQAGVRWFDDSKGTNVGATVAAMRGLPGLVVLIAGGEGKSQDFAPLCAALNGKARAVVLIGRDAPLIAAALGDSVPLHLAADMDQAVARAAQLAQPGDSVLLSPACASFDMFSGYEERGAVFAAAVRRLTEC